MFEYSRINVSCLYKEPRIYKNQTLLVQWCPCNSYFYLVRLVVEALPGSIPKLQPTKLVDWLAIHKRQPTGVSDISCQNGVSLPRGGGWLSSVDSRLQRYRKEAPTFFVFGWS
jgi:hypothetical protein